MEYKATPEAGKTCTFYDAGKRSDSRTYEAEVLCITSKKKARSIKFPQYYDTYSCCLTTIPLSDSNDNPIDNISLYEVWSDAVSKHPDWYAKDTDCFIECSIPDYDPYSIWFARSADGGWYSLDIQNCWQHGELVVD